MTPRAKRISVIMEETARSFGCTKEELLAYNRGLIIDDVRAIAMHLARVILVEDHSTTSIGKAFKRDHSTVVTNTARVRRALLKRPQSWFSRRVRELEERLSVQTHPQEICFPDDLPTGQQPTVEALSSTPPCGRVTKSGGDRE